MAARSRSVVALARVGLQMPSRPRLATEEKVAHVHPVPAVVIVGGVYVYVCVCVRVCARPGSSRCVVCAEADDPRVTVANVESC